MPAGAVAGDAVAAGGAAAGAAEGEGAELVFGFDDGAAVLGGRAVLPPHGADQHAVRLARGRADRAGGGAGGTVAAPPRGARVVEERAAGTGDRVREPGGPPPAD